MAVTTKTRTVSVCPESRKDYMDMEHRRIYATEGILELADAIYNEPVLLSTNDKLTKFRVRNCEFKNGLHIRAVGLNSTIYLTVFESKVSGTVGMASDQAGYLSIDNSEVGTVFISGRLERIDLYGSTIGLFQTEGLVCKNLRVEKTFIQQYGLYKFRCEYVEFDTDDLAISDWSRFKAIDNLSVRRCAEEYHLLALQSSRTIRSNVDIRYQLAKATSYKAALVFGYFHKPWHIIGWMSVVIFIYGLLYTLLLSIDFSKAIFFSVFTFFTIGYEKAVEASWLQTVLVYSEVVLGVVYSAALLISIMNATRKTK